MKILQNNLNIQYTHCGSSPSVFIDMHRVFRAQVGSLGLGYRFFMISSPCRLNNNNVVIPVLSYENSDTEKKAIYQDNYKKTGIYRWTHKESGKSYVGSSLNIAQIFVKYYSVPSLLRETKRNNSAIYRALLKYGNSGFRFNILEHCGPNILIEREQYYLDLLKPEYNILKIAGNRAGFLHSEATKELQRAAVLGRVLSLETKSKMRNYNLKTQSVIVTNITTGEIQKFLAMRSAGEYLETSHSQIGVYARNNKLFRGIYSIEINKKS